MPYVEELSPENLAVVQEFFDAMKGEVCPSVQQVSNWLERFPGLASEIDRETLHYYDDEDDEPDFYRSHVPLHAIIKKFATSVPLAIIKKLVEAWPEAVAHKDEYADTPLHLACWHNAPLAIVQYLAELNPKAISKARGLYTPVHCLLKRRGRLDVLEYLCKTWTDEAFCSLYRNRSKENILRTVLEWDISIFEGDSTPPVQYLQTLVRCNPDLLTVLDMDGSTGDPSSHLQKVVWFLPKEDNDGKWIRILRWLLTVEPDAIRRPAHNPGMTHEDGQPVDGDLPLYTFMRRISTRGLSDFYLEVLQILVDAWPEARTRKSPSGYLPLDCATKIPRETILPVLVENPQEAMQYYFKHGGRKIETVDWLLHRNLGALAESDGDGNLPLHCAVLSAGTPRIVLNLMQAFPLAVCMRNRRGKLPLHIAAQHSRDPQVVELLARVAPLLIGEKDGEGWLPFQLAAQNCSRATSVGFRRVAFLCPGLEMTYHLLRKSPDTLQSQGDDDE